MKNVPLIALVFITVYFALLISGNDLQNLRFSFNFANATFKPLKHFWRSCGFWYGHISMLSLILILLICFNFSPPDPKSSVPENLLSEDVKLNLALVGSLPNNAIRQVRVHWLLNSIVIER